jgi:hypothetical protein
MRSDEFSTLAKKMGGGARHAAALRTLSKAVRIEINNASLHPSNRDIRTAIKKLRAECDRFTVALNGVGGRKLLYFPAVNIELLSEARSNIEGVKALCERALEKNPSDHGNPKPGMAACALIVSEVWASINHRAPGHNNDKAHDACEEYWQACKQPASKAVGRWGYYLKQARGNRRPERYLWISQEVSRIAEGK